MPPRRPTGSRPDDDRMIIGRRRILPPTQRPTVRRMIWLEPDLVDDTSARAFEARSTCGMTTSKTSHPRRSRERRFRTGDNRGVRGVDDDDAGDEALVAEDPAVLSRTSSARRPRSHRHRGSRTGTTPATRATPSVGRRRRPDDEDVLRRDAGGDRECSIGLEVPPLTVDWHDVARSDDVVHGEHFPALACPETCTRAVPLYGRHWRRGASGR